MRVTGYLLADTFINMGAAFAVYFLQFEDGGYVVHPLLGSPLVFKSESDARACAERRFDKDSRFPSPVMGMMPDYMETIE